MSGQKRPSVIDEERIMQAIVLGDSFNERFMPITLDKPRCLLPVLNVPLIEYTLEFLAMSGIQDVILFCRSHADQLREYVGQSRWCKPTSTLTVQIVVNSECCSVGDALRDIDSRQLIRGDFVLCYGDTVANVDLGVLLSKFREHRRRDKSLIMTMVTKRTLPEHRSREHGELAVFGLASGSNNEVKFYSSLGPNSPKHAAVKLPIELLSEQKELELRLDLLDCNIDVCSPEVLASFTENFDYQDLREDFVRGILSNWELLGQRLNVHILEDEYAARIRNSALYDAVSCDLLGRWVFPIVPDGNVFGLEDDPGDNDRLVLLGRETYSAKSTILARTAVVGPRTLLGAGSTISANSRVAGSVLGRNVQVGADCWIENSYLWDGVVVESGCHLSGCIISDHARIKSGSHIPPGCLITSDVTIGPKAQLSRNCRVAKFSDRMDQAMQALGLGSFEALTNVATSSVVNLQRILGKENDGVIWEIAEDKPIFTIGLSEGQQKQSLQSEEDLSADLAGLVNSNKSKEPLPASDEEDAGKAAKAGSSFAIEARDMLIYAFQNEYSVDNAALELNALKFAYNASFGECRRAIVLCLLSEAQDSTDLAVSLAKTWAPLLAKYTTGCQDELHVLETLGSAGQPTIVPFVVPIFYDCDVVCEDAYMQWFDCLQHSADDHMLMLARRLMPFRDFLLQSDDDESE